MYNLSVGAIFKNESHSLKEWIEHYLFHGVEHIYLINDNSNDNFEEILKPYIEKEIVTLFNCNYNYYLGRQRDMLSFYFLPILQDTNWLIIVDLDEYLWSPNNIDLKKELDNCQLISQIQLVHSLYGSNGHLKQPEFLVKSFTKRAIEIPFKNYKYIINSKFKFTYLNVHHADYENPEEEKISFLLLGPEYFILNHYSCQSKDFWINVKCTRGDCDNFTNRTEELFSYYDINEIEDLGLWEQNKDMEIYNDIIS
jgi:hypothetical protein